MTERLNRHYLKANEQEFLEDFPDCVAEAKKILMEEWRLGGQLTFDSAAVYWDETGFSSVQIALCSPGSPSRRHVTVQVRKQGKGFVAKKIVDRTDDT